jgi:hypothetical protein
VQRNRDDKFDIIEKLSTGHRCAIYLSQLVAYFTNPPVLEIMDELPYSAVAIIEGESSSPLYPASPPEKPRNRIVGFEVIVGTRYKQVASGAYEVFITHKVIATGITYPGKEDTEDIIQQIRKIIHAASRISSLKIIKLKDNLTADPVGYAFEFFGGKFQLGIFEINILH